MSETGIPTPTYGSFLAQALREIYLLSVYGSPMEYFKAVRKFSFFLPPEVKELIQPKMKEIDEAVVEAIKSSETPAGKHYSQVKRMNTLNRVCRVLVDPLVGEMVDVLHGRGWIEKKFVRSGPELLKPLYEGEEAKEEEEEEE